MTERLFVKITRDLLPQAKDRFPFLYLERGRLEVDDSSVKWVDCSGEIIPIPVATISALLLGPGTSVTHDAVRTSTAANCALAWVGEDALIFYAAGILTTSDTKGIKKQIDLYANPQKRLEVARKMFSYRFPDADLAGKSLKEMMGMEGYRVRELYQEKAKEYQVGWKGRNFSPGSFEMSDITNKNLTTLCAHLYGVVASVVHSMGLSPHIGFIHSGSPLPFVYDLADLYKAKFCVDVAFKVTKLTGGVYDKKIVSASFRKAAVEMDLMGNVVKDINNLILEKSLGKTGGDSC